MLYRITPGWQASLTEVEAALDRARFVPCGASQPLSVGWVPPRGAQHGVLAESVQGQWLLRLCVEQKLLPSSVVKNRAAEIADHLELTTGRKPGKKQLRELREQATQELLPQAFTRLSAVQVWMDTQAGLLMIDTTSAARAEDAVTLLVKTLDGFGVQALHTRAAPATAMAGWLLSGEPPAGFSVDRDCELKAPDESRAAVRYARHALDIDEVRAHIEAGKQPTRLAMTWSSRVGLVLTEALQIKRIAFEDVVFEAARAAGQEDDFDTDVALATGELSALIRDLIEALGGELAPGEVPVPAPDAAAPGATAAVPPSPAVLQNATDDEPPPWA